MTKHLINKHENWAKDSIHGYLLANNTSLVALEEYPNVILRKDYLSLEETSSRVALLSGGGSGHEPAHLGFVGKGMLTGVICGDLFASPSTAAILAAIRAVGTHNKAGVLLIVKNYTGDRLNFGIAAKRAQLEGINVDWVLVDDDVALVRNEHADDSVGRRGLCGTVFVHKLAGAMAEQRKSLSEIKQFLDLIIKHNCIRTLGVSLSGRVSLPGEPKSKSQLDNDQIEIGLGIHGEAGRHRTSLTPSAQLVSNLFEEFFPFETASHEPDICLMVNNLGGLSNLELYLLVDDCCRYFREKKPDVKIKRLYAGTLMTSLNMNGFSLTVFNLNSNVKQTALELLDQNTSAPSWPKSCAHDLDLFDPSQSIVSSSRVKTTQNQSGMNDQYLRVDDNLAAKLKFTLKTIAEDLTSMRDYLNELDSKCGDGDCGNSLNKIAENILADIDGDRFESFAHPHQILLHCAGILENGGGTLCILLSLFATSAANSFKRTGKNDPVDWVQVWTDAVVKGLEAVEEYGKARPGQRSIVDPLDSVCKYLKEIVAEKSTQHRDLNQLFKDLVDVSYKSAQATSTMKPRVGRASYVDSSVIKQADAGSIAINSIFASIYKSSIMFSDA